MNNINLLSANWPQLLVKIRTTSLQFLCQYNPLYKILLSENLYANTIKHSPRQFIGGIKNPLPMKPAVLKILTFCLLLISAASCKKSDTGSAVVPKTKTILLTQNAWKIQSVGLDANKDGIAETDVTVLIQACKLDNTYSFKTDGTGTADEGATKCVSTDPQTKAFTWVFKNNESVLSGTFSFTSSDATIISMDDNKLVVAYDDVSTSSHLVATLQH